MKTIRIQTKTGLLIGKIIEDDSNILEDQRKMIEESNKKLNLAGKTEIF